MSERLSHDLMTPTHSSATVSRWPRLTDWELAWCLRSQRVVRHRFIIRLFAVVSRLGDGVFWYSLMAALLLVDGAFALPVVGQMLLAGGLSLLLYKWLKMRTTRSRPCARNQAIERRVAPLDEYSFPSGHTLHAVSFSLVAVYYYPMLGWVLIPFAALVALSRIVLGLHYPSDVLVGALLGAALAALVLQGTFIQL